MTRLIFTFCLTLLILLLAACTEAKPISTPAPVVVIPSAIPATTPAPTLTPTPAKMGRWECYQGGVACSHFLFDISMLNAEEGWAVGRAIAYSTE